MSRQNTNLSRETIAAVALQIADKEGFDAVSMRRVAQELNVGTMSLYYYVKTKDDLIAVMDDALLGEALLPSLPKGWQPAMIAIAKHTHALFLRHPWALVSMLSAPPGLNAMRHMEQCLEALAETHMTNSEKLSFLATVDDFVFGHALREAANNTAIDTEFAAAQLATGAFPRIAKIFAKGRIETGKDRFEQGLQALLNGLPYAASISESAKKKSKKKKDRH
jgi:AcrR family transcriptional regulator